MSESLSTMEYESLEQKYVEVRTKLKRSLQNNEKNTVQIQKLNKRIKLLEDENSHLQNQIQNFPSTAVNDSESDVSSSDRSNLNKSNMENLVHSKNLQISDLLKDIEDIEKENMILREKLAETKDALSTATSEISYMTETLKAKDVTLQEQYELTQKMSVEIENLKEEIEVSKNEKSEIENNLEIFSQQVNKKVDEWKELLDKKNSEIAKLKSVTSTKILKTSSTSSEDQEPVNDKYLGTLKMALFEAETKLGVLKSELERCTQDLKESTEIINKLKGDKNDYEKRIKKMIENEKELKAQLSKSHDRCQNLQKEVEFANKLTKVFENDLSKLKAELKSNGQIDLVTSLEENQSLKIQNVLYEKQVVGLIKDINKLQEMCNVFEVENSSLRHQLGIEAEENIKIDPKFLTERKKQQQLIEKLKTDVQNGNEKNIKLKIEIKDLTRKIGYLQSEILELKNNPEIEQTTVSPIKTIVNAKKERSQDIKALSEENEALRKGLHEILNSVQEKSDVSPREIKSDILERLLKTLDVKHISGWYHPAMRLQAELHTLEGVNRELREQLYEARTNLDKLMRDVKEKDLSKSPEKILNNSQTIPSRNTEDKTGIIEILSSNNYTNLQELKMNILNIIKSLSESDADIENTLEQEFKTIQKCIEVIHQQCNAERVELLDNLKSDNKNINEEMEEGQVMDKIENKNTFVIQEINKWKTEVTKLKENIAETERKYSTQLEGYVKKFIFLQLKLRLKDNISSVTVEQFQQVQGALNEQVVKYRKLLNDFEEQNKNGILESETLKQIEEDLTKENSELKAKLKQLLCNSSQENYKHVPDHVHLSQKLADVKIEALSEKQRADHTNNLYKLVKEQLRKSEENFTEFSKYGENLLQKNLTLQERVVDLEDKISVYGDANLNKELEEKLSLLIKQNEQLISENESLRKKCEDTEKPLKQLSKWNHEKEQELLGLKHQIVDLTSTSDEKLLIGQLHSDLSKCRLEERENEIKIDFLRNEIIHWERRYKELNLKIEEERIHFEKRSNAANKKISVLQNLLMKQRIQYHGFVPLISQEIYADKIKAINRERHEIFITLQNLKKLETAQEVGKKSVSSRQDTGLELDQSERQNEFKNQQIQYLTQRIEAQETQMEKLEQELLKAYKDMDLSINNNTKFAVKKPVLVRKIVSQESLDPRKKEPQIQILRNMESQTESINDKPKEDEITLLKIQVQNLENQISARTQHLSDTNSLLIQKEMEVKRIKGQLDDKNKQVAFLERKVKEFKENCERNVERHDNGAAGDGVSVKNNFLDEQIISLRTTLKTVQDKLSHKEKDIIKYQALLKEDRDKHSLAAANLQHELSVLKKALALEQQKNTSLVEATAMSRQKSAVVETYVSQVRALEKHLAELHTQQAKLESQLHASQQEATRWRQMAQERLIAMQELGKSLNEQHKKELTSYKTDYEKLRELSEEEMPKHKVVNVESNLNYAGYIDPEVLKLCREKDEKIKELCNKLQKLETTEKIEIDLSGTGNERGTLGKENEVLRKRYEALLIKEKNAREEIRDLKDQLSKRTNLSARTKQSEKSIKEQLQRKINLLEKEIDDLNDKFAQQLLLNEKHKLSSNEDFGKWKKQKYWQENCEKYKNKLQEREEELQKLQQACTGFRMLIERLEREKINLENRIKTLKSNPRVAVADQEIEVLKSENLRLTCELAKLEEKMEIRQQGAGALGAAIMQEKLEAQERKIAVLELSAKGTVEVRNELERLQTSLSNTQKRNLCLEAENLELKMDMEKYSKETPHLQEQIQHLENYIELLKSENQTPERQMENNDDKKVSQLERTVFILKRVVEKLQVENKRLNSGKRPLSERSSSAEKLKRDYLRLKDQNTENLQKIKDFETKLSASNKKIQLLGKKHPENEKMEQLRSQLDQVKEQLAHKTLLLDKVKTLLHGAAAKEKLLLKEITELRQSNTEKDFDTGYSIEVPSPIEEVSEENSI